MDCHQLDADAAEAVAMTQRDALLAYLQRHGRISPLEALRELGIYRLAARIIELRAAGHDIRTRLVDGHAVYELVRPPAQLWTESELRYGWGDR